MGSYRQPLLAILILIAGFFSISPATATDHVTCDDIGPQAFRIATLGVGVHGVVVTTNLASMAAPACFTAEETNTESAITESLSCETMGPTAFRSLPVSGVGVSGSMAIMAAPACLLSLDLPGTTTSIALPGANICDTNGGFNKHDRPCRAPD